MTFTVRGQAELDAKLRASLERIRVQSNKAVQKAGINTQKDAKIACPVDTGRLRASIQYIPYISRATVGTNVEYGPFVEFGTSKMREQPFLLPAYDKNVRLFIIDCQIIARGGSI